MDLRDVEKIAHHLAEKFARTGLTFDDVLIEPRFSTEAPHAHLTEGRFIQEFGDVKIAPGTAL
jgi:hypothetical protein